MSPASIPFLGSRILCINCFKEKGTAFWDVTAYNLVVFTDDSDEHKASIFTVEEKAEQAFGRNEAE
jgi:hypothetical protein